MTPRDRQLASIDHHIPDQIPVDIVSPFEDLGAVADGLGTEKTTEAVYQRLGIDGWRIFTKGYLGQVYQTVDGKKANAWGIVDRPPLANCTDVRIVEKHPWPDPRQWDFSHAPEEANRMKQQYAVRGPGWMFGTLCRAFELMGVEEALVAMKAEPAVFEAVLDHVTRHNVAYLEYFLSVCGDDVDILWLGDDFSTQRGPMMSHTDWRRFLLPCFRRQFEVGLRAGKRIWFHSCGDITDVLPDLIDIGMNVWETVQLHTLPLSPQELKREFGRDITFFGGIPTQRLPFMSLQEVVDTVRATIEALGEGGGYICCADHQIRIDVSTEKIAALFQSAQVYRGAGYTVDT